MEKNLESRRHAGLLTRVLYCSCLLAIALGGIFQSGWVSLATGGGLSTWISSELFTAVLILIVFRVCVVATSPSSLDSRTPNLIGKLLRFAGTLVMWVGFIGLLAQFVVRPLTLLLFGSIKTESGVEFFVVGLYASLASSVGWLGCLLFEFSRFWGRKPLAANSPQKSKWPFPHGAILLGISGLIIGLPHAIKLYTGAPCYGKLLSCTSSVEIVKNRSITLDRNKPVRLDANFEAIVYQSKKGTRTPIKETLKDSISAMGFVITDDPAVQEKIIVMATIEKQAITVNLFTLDVKGTATHKVTRFTSKAQLEESTAGMKHIVVQLGSNYQGMPSSFIDSSNGIILDGLFAQLRDGFISTAKAEENKLLKTYSLSHFNQSTEPLGPLSDAQSKVLEEQNKIACSLVISMKGSQGAREWELNSYGNPMIRVTFITPEAKGRFTHVNNWDDIRCNEFGVWYVERLPNSNSLRVGRYANDGRLSNYVEIPLQEKPNMATSIYWGEESPKLTTSTMLLSFAKYFITGKGGREKLTYSLPLQ